MVFGGIASLIITTVTCKPASALMVASEMKNCARGVNGIVVKNTLFFVGECIDAPLILLYYSISERLLACASVT